jgi:hypothetical protein
MAHGLFSNWSETVLTSSTFNFEDIYRKIDAEFKRKK